MPKLEEEFNELCRDVFDQDDLVVSRETVAQDVEGWDSLTHIKLILEVERRFKIRFSAGEVVGIKNVGGLLDLISAKGGRH